MFKKIHVLSTSIVTLSVFGLFLLNACKKQSCFDAALKAEYASKGCYQDCPGVTGCDGKFYCNSCIAAQAGISAVD